MKTQETVMFILCLFVWGCEKNDQDREKIDPNCLLCHPPADNSVHFDYFDYFDYLDACTYDNTY